MSSHDKAFGKSFASTDLTRNCVLKSFGGFHEETNSVGVAPRRSGVICERGYFAQCARQQFANPNTGCAIATGPSPGTGCAIATCAGPGSGEAIATCGDAASSAQPDA